MDDDLTVKQAADILGVHSNTIRYRIKKGLLPATKILSAQGPMHMIKRSDVEEQATNGVVLESSPKKATGQESPVVAHNAVAPIGGFDLEGAIQRIIAPVVAELGTAREELGKVKAERDAALARIGELEATRARKSWWKRIFG